MSKYKNIRAGGFDSRKEARRFQELMLMQRAGQISGLQRQVPFELLPAQREPERIGARGGRKPGRVLERRVVYVADFVYTLPGVGQIVEDCKGMRTPEYIIKRKLMLWRYGIRILET